MSKSAPQVSVIQMYAPRQQIYPRETDGRYARLRWMCVWLTQMVFYGLPWLSWNDRQAVLFDLVGRKFYIFGMVLWPQDFIYLALLLIVCAFSLFLFTAVAGRIWCGYACPQTVYTEVFLWIERKFEGTRSARMRLDKQPWSLEKAARKGGKHLAWGLVALWTGYTFVGYFTPIKLLGGEALHFTLGPWEWFWIAFYAFATYGNAGWMREQVCKYMCPYARFQSSMFDRDTLIITYDQERGEPRGANRKQTMDVARGDCIDCTMCVQVCPTGIDIRNGLQSECIGCAACVDACNVVMDKIGKPRGLIRYATENAMQLKLSVREIVRRALRPRVLVYCSLLLAVTALLATSMATRPLVKMDVMRDRGALGREVDDGMIENVYRLQIMNIEEAPRRYHIAVKGVDGISLASPNVAELAATESRAVPVRVRLPAGAGQAGANKIEFELRALDGGHARVKEKAVFLVPR